MNRKVQVRFGGGQTEKCLKGQLADCLPDLFCESTHHPEQIDIVLANLADQIDREPQAHYYFSDRAGWVTVGDDLPRFGGETGTEPLKEP